MKQTSRKEINPQRGTSTIHETKCEQQTNNDIKKNQKPEDRHQENNEEKNMSNKRYKYTEPYENCNNTFEKGKIITCKQNGVTWNGHWIPTERCFHIQQVMLDTSYPKEVREWEQSKRTDCFGCEGTGIVYMHNLVSSSYCEFWTDNEEPCPMCGGGMP